MIQVIILQPLLATILTLAAPWSNPLAIPRERESTTKRQAVTAALAQAQADSPRADYFSANVRPLLEKRCQPCHFKGGKMYARLPFDNPKTIQTLNAKLFTRIRDEKEQAVIRSFLAQTSGATKSSSF